MLREDRKRRLQMPLRRQLHRRWCRLGVQCRRHRRLRGMQRVRLWCRMGVARRRLVWQRVQRRRLMGALFKCRELLRGQRWSMRGAHMGRPGLLQQLL